MKRWCMALLLVATATGVSRAEEVPCQEKIVIDSVVTTQAGGGYYSAILQLRNVSGKTLKGTLQFATFPVSVVQKASGTRTFTLAPNDIWSTTIAMTRPAAMSKSGVTLVYDSASLPGKSVAVRASGCSTH